MDPDLRGGSTSEIDQQEVEFWNGMISQYLFPLEKNKVRNGSGFGVINFLQLVFKIIVKSGRVPILKMTVKTEFRCILHY